MLEDGADDKLKLRFCMVFAVERDDAEAKDEARALRPRSASMIDRQNKVRGSN